MNQRSLVFDVGNTHTVVGVYTGGSLAHQWRLATDKRRTGDEHYCLMSDLLHTAAINPRDFDICALASVVPDITRAFSQMINKYFGCRLVVVSGHSELGLSFPITDPGCIGADLIVNAYAAWRKYQRPCAVCDFGTATTIQLVGADGYFHGVIIAPGVLTASGHLFEKAALLAHVELEPPRQLLGTTTRDALLSGILSGSAFMIDGFIDRIRQEYAHLGEIYAIGTGGIASVVCDLSRTIDRVDKTLTLDGLHLICNHSSTA
ncbi:MAG: type III pantothenate kinase [Candidatus Cloacimonetes bacterium]|nr:type III pantothenate kinase [Candidatus Cloacimonadota bacterium]